MDLDKLEKLSCLKISDDLKAKVSLSLEGIIAMLKEIDEVPPPQLHPSLPEITVFRQTSVIKSQKEGLHLQDGVFLAPKVLDKD